MTLRMDLWPAEVVLPDGRLIQGARFMLTQDQRVAVWQDWTGVAKLAYLGKMTDHSRLPERGAIWYQQRITATVEGGTLLANQTATNGCGCNGSPLRDLIESDIPE